ncbi:MAG: ribbon-helix-helix protein, CopG family [Clostridium sp.]|nr:ribbon-helix-helix protein, CopG family [Clostridium sp.]
MARRKVAVTLDEKTLVLVDRLVTRRAFPSRSQVIQEALEFYRKGQKAMSKKNVDPVGRSWNEVRAELFAAEEIAASDLRVAVIGELIKVRQEQLPG